MSLENPLDATLSDQVATDIMGAWEQLAAERLRLKDYWRSEDPEDCEQWEIQRQWSLLPTCEALECLLLPALPFALDDGSESLHMRDRFVEFLSARTDDFAKVFIADLNRVIEEAVDLDADGNVIATKFFIGPPYSGIQSDMVLRNAMPQSLDCASFVLTTLIHAWRVLRGTPYVSSRPGGIREDSLKRVCDSAMKFIVEKCSVKDEGWKWTDSGEDIPSTLYFTWSGVAAFADVDEFLIDRDYETGAVRDAFLLEAATGFDQSAVEAYESKIGEVRKWLLGDSRRLRAMYRDCPVFEDSAEYPLTADSLKNRFSMVPDTANLSDADERSKYRQGDEKVTRKLAGESQYLPLFLNNLMVIDMLILTWADLPKNLDEVTQGDEDGFDFREQAQVRQFIEKSLYGIVDRVSGSESLRGSVASLPYMFTLPTGGILKKPEELLAQGLVDETAEKYRRLRYGDRAFLPTLMRVIVEAMEYNLGNPFVLNGTLMELYRILLSNRNRIDSSMKYSYVWGRDRFSIRDTERAMEALRDLYRLAVKQEDSRTAGAQGAPRPTALTADEAAAVALTLGVLAARLGLGESDAPKAEAASPDFDILREAIVAWPDMANAVEDFRGHRAMLEQLADGWSKGDRSRFQGIVDRGQSVLERFFREPQSSKDLAEEMMLVAEDLGSFSMDVRSKKGSV